MSGSARRPRRRRWRRRRRRRRRLRQAEPSQRAAAGAQCQRRAARPRREGRTRRRGPSRRSPQPPPGDPQVPSHPKPDAAFPITPSEDAVLRGCSRQRRPLREGILGVPPLRGARESTGLPRGVSGGPRLALLPLQVTRGRCGWTQEARWLQTPGEADRWGSDQHLLILGRGPSHVNN